MKLSRPVDWSGESAFHAVAERQPLHLKLLPCQGLSLSRSKPCNCRANGQAVRSHFFTAQSSKLAGIEAVCLHCPAGAPRQSPGYNTLHLAPQAAPYLSLAAHRRFSLAARRICDIVYLYLHGHIIRSSSLGAVAFNSVGRYLISRYLVSSKINVG